MPSPIPMTFSAVDSYAAGNNFNSVNRSPRTIMAQAIRAILLASATAATLIGRRSIRRASQGRFVPCCRAYRITAIAPATSSHRDVDRPALRSCRAAPCPRSNAVSALAQSTQRDCGPTDTVQSPTSLTSAVATIGPMPGISSSRRLSSHDRCQAWMCFSRTLISALITAYCRARTSRLNRAAAGCDHPAR